MILALLRFIYLTLPNCAGKLLKTLSKEEKQEKKSTNKGRKMNSIASNSPWRVAKESKGRRAYLLASNSPPVRNGELHQQARAERHVHSPPTRPQLAMASNQRASKGRSIVLLAMASAFTCEAS